MFLNFYRKNMKNVLLAKETSGIACDLSEEKLLVVRHLDADNVHL